MSSLILASRNPHKIIELQDLLTGTSLRVLSALDFDNLEEVEEDALTLEGNALKKARYTALATGMPCLADDTGLEVNALNGAPGVYSARYAGPHASYEDNVEKLLSELADKELRTAQFRTVIAFVDGTNEWLFEGICKGIISDKQIGSGGFGYDPIFIPDQYTKTFAELDSKEKNQISHRGLAMKKAVEFLEKWA
ncbi:MAG: RdgB/HAM1 family non-canonical purine NTP pyrophosphatase [Bacteroidetes bacterium]|jgi:XTP/dITP diphosphohydrolase|nr:RdgB/HAM1 family non-canonical purine NTP pyrophosphatase [Bacteroidota bacterium]